LSLRKFFAYSITFHIFFLCAVILSTPAVKEKKLGGEIFTMLVSPDEFLAKKPPAPSIPVGRPAIPGRQMHSKPSSVLKDENQTILSEKEGPSYELPPPAKPQSSQETKGNTENLNPIKNQGKENYPMREKLFDKGIIGDIAKRDIDKEEEGVKKGTTFSLDTKGYKYLIYNRRLKERIESIWIYPPDEASKGIYGDLIIKFTILKNGTLGDIELVRTSGFKNLDDAAMKALKEGEPYWPLPDEWGMNSYTIEGHFIYTIFGYYIR
jgi:protein TonB